MIKFEGVSKVYESTNTKALNNFSVEIETGEFVFIVGSSGAGKSTLLKLMMREEVPTSGTININGFDLNSIKKSKIPYFRRSLGIVFQDFRLIPTMNVYDNVAYAMRVIGARENAIRKRVPYLLGLVGLNSKARSKPNQLSGGEQQRVALARALANNANTIIADEPTGNVDPKMSYEIVDLLNHINADGTTVIMVTHDLHLVKTFNHRVITIKNGVIESDYPDASHIDVEPYKFDNPEDTVGSYFVEESGDDLDYLFQNYAVDIDAESISDSFEMAESDVYEIPQDASFETEPLTKEGDAE
ncbi:MAG: cell division ATP-binding protein FtsE [Clostridia bacterium]|nr:cell division ATP-binding protein FtsE [Clostridia bacterium]